MNWQSRIITSVKDIVILLVLGLIHFEVFDLPEVLFHEPNLLLACIACTLQHAIVNFSLLLMEICASIEKPAPAQQRQLEKIFSQNVNKSFSIAKFENTDE